MRTTMRTSERTKWNNRKGNINTTRWSCVWLVLTALLLGSCAATSDSAQKTDGSAASAIEAEAQIQELYASWRRAVDSSDIPGYVDVLHPDVQMWPPGAPPVVGADKYAAFLQPVFAAATYRVEIVQLQKIDVFGDTAIAEYEYIIHLDLKNPDQGVQEPGALTAQRTQARYFDVLRKRSDGRWGVWRHMWQDTTP